jgi:hypothetical protein
MSAQSEDDTKKMSQQGVRLANKTIFETFQGREFRKKVATKSSSWSRINKKQPELFFT